MEDFDGEEVMENTENDSENWKSEHINPGAVAVTVDVAVADLKDRDAWA